MKKIESLFVTAQFVFLFAAGFYFSGCSDSITNSTATTTDKYQAHTEAEFNANSILKAIPGAVVYLDLEHLNSPASGVNGDTGPIGEDVIPYTYTETATHRIKLGTEAQFKIRLVSESGEVIYQLNNPGDSARVNIPAGNHKLFITSTINYDAGLAETSQPVFIQQDLDAIKGGYGAASQGGYNSEDLNKLITTKKCVGCNLVGVEIQDKILIGADLSYAKLMFARIKRVDFTGGKFIGTKWDAIEVFKSSFKGATISEEEIVNATFDSVNFSGAHFANLPLDRAKFLNCDLTYADMNTIGTRHTTNISSFNNSDLSYATITNAALFHLQCKNSKFVRTTFSEVEFNDMTFENSKLDSAKFLNRCEFLGSTIKGGSVTYGVFTDFSGAGSVFDNCYLIGSKITNSDFSSASLRGANLQYTNWNNVNINGADMCEQNRNWGPVFTGITYDLNTKCWP